MKHIHAVLFSLSLFLFPFTSFAQEMSQGQKIEIEKDDLRDRVYSVRIKDNTFGGGVNFSFSAPQITTRSSLILDYKELAKQYLATYGGHFGITDVATQFFEGEVTVDNFGMAHVRFPQAYQGVAVTNGEMIVHIRSNGALKTINGIFVKGLSGLNATPSITEKEATAVAASYWQLKYGVSYEVDDIALVIISPSELKNKDGKSYLSWRIRLRNDGEFLDENVFIDAHTANYITYESNIRAAHGEKTPIYRRIGELAPDGQWWLNGVFPEYPGYVFGRLEARPPRGPNPYVNDGKSGPDTAYTRLNHVHKFFQNELGINGPNGNGGVFVAESGIAKGQNVTDANIDSALCPSNGMFSNNLIFVFCGYSKLEDLLGHEYSHAIGWGILKYAGESGAIEEAIADLGGYRFQKYLKGSTDWVCETQSEDELPYRNSKTPGVGTLYPSPVHWYDSNTKCDSMHVMSTVASHAAYLASEGGEREGCRVRPVGIERVHNVWFHARLNYFPSTVTYNSSISYIMDACDDLYPNTVNPKEFSPICYQIKKSMLATKMDQRGYCNDKRKIYEKAPSCDFCPDNPNKEDIGCSGNCDGEADLDSDGDGTPDCYDECPKDPNKVTAGRCGCGNKEEIEDLDDDTFWGVGSCPAIRNDCDDTKFNSFYKGSLEIRGDGIDNDCDGMTDEAEIISKSQKDYDYSEAPDISGDGRYIVFLSNGAMPEVARTNRYLNVFLYDSKLNTYTLISKDASGLEGNGLSLAPRISKKGETVVFQSYAKNLNGKILAWTKEEGLQVVTSEGGNRPSVSPDGRYITYDNGGVIYIWNKETGKQKEIPMDGISASSEISANGKYVAFCSSINHSINGDWSEDGIFLYNTKSEEIELVAQMRSDLDNGSCPTMKISISDNGRYITYSGLLTSNTYTEAHIYLWDRDTKKTTLVDTKFGKTSIASNGASYDPNISGDGRYITFRSSATNLIKSGSIGTLPNIFLYDKSTSKIELISTTFNGETPDKGSFKSGVSDDGSTIVFDSYASNLIERALDINKQRNDVFAVYRDVCPDDPDKYSVGECGCGVPDTDSNGNGIADCKEGSISILDEDEEGFLDKCPNDPNKTEPGICGCGVPDIDTDGDGVFDCHDKCPNDPKKVFPGICGCGVVDSTKDSDRDGTPDCIDKCPYDPKKTDPGFCGCGRPETDSDKDGVPNCIDKCPYDPKKTDPGVCGCGRPETDSDGDGTPDCKDRCPNDPNKTSPGRCGCGKPDIDSDGDGVLDCNDRCPNDPKKTQPGRCGCGVVENTKDSDRDGVPDCIDGCPSNPKKTKPDEWGCAVTDRDSDRDGIPDIFDGCPYDPNKSAPQICGCGVVDSAKNIADDDKDGVAACNDVCPLEPDALTQEGPSTTPVWFKDGIQNIADFKDIFVNIGDLNRDGHDDVALVQPLTQKGSVLASVSIYYGGVKGISSKSPTLLNQYGATQNVVSSVIKGGDINGDGYGDVIVIDQKSKGRIFVYYGSSSGVRSTPASVINNTKYITDLTVFSAGDINGDGYSDVVVSSKSFGVHVYYGRTAGLPNTPNDIIPTEKVLQIAAAKPAGDLNNDGYDDLIAYGRYNGTYKGEGGRVLQNPSFIAIYLGSYTGITKTPSEVYVLENLYHVSAIGDVNGDGYGDVAVNYGDSKLTGTGRQGLVSIFYSKSSKVFRKPAITLGREISEGADYFDFGAVLPTITGDFNGDTYPDIVITTKDFVFIYYGGSNGVKATPALILDYKEKHSSSLSSINSIDVPDLNGDGFSDLILTGLNLKGKELRAEAFLGGNLRSGPTVKPCGEGDEEDQDDASSSGADEPEDVLTCSDSDGGKNKMVSGVTRYRNLTFKDRCSSKKLLIEYFCNPAGFPTLQLFHCKNGCEAGACKTVQTLKLSKKQRRKQRKQRRLFRKSLQSYIGVQ